MTVVVGVVCSDGSVVLHADTDGTNGYVQRPYAPKIIPCKRMALGYTDSYRLGQVAGYSWLPRIDQNRRSNDYEWWSTEAMEFLRAELRDAGIISVENQQESGGHILVAVPGALWMVNREFAVHRMESPPYYAIGSGAELALGALHAQLRGEPAKNVLHAREVGVTAARVAIELNPNCNGDVVEHVVKREREGA